MDATLPRLAGSCDRWAGDLGPVPEVLAGDRSTIGERLAGVQLRLLEDPNARQRLTGLVRAASSEPDAARMLREFLMREIIGPVAETLDADEPELRVSLVGPQIIGLMMIRYITQVEPLASLPTERLVQLVGPTLQNYLTHPLPPKEGHSASGLDLRVAARTS